MTQTVALKPVIELLFPAGETRRFVGEWGEVLTIGDLSAGTYRLTVPVLANDEMQIAPVESSLPLRRNPAMPPRRSVHPVCRLSVMPARV